MKIVIPSKGRADTISSHIYLGEDKDYSIFVHNKAEQQQYLKNKTIPPEKIVVADVPFGVSPMRKFIRDEYLPKGSWYLTMDDNVRGMRRLSDEFYKNPTLDSDNILAAPKLWGSRFKTEMPADEFLAECEKEIEHAKRIGAKNIGFATTSNPLFRKRKYNLVAYIISKVAVQENNNIEFDQNIQAMDDYAYTAECLLQHGKVLRCNYIRPIASHYQKGGIGPYAERATKKIADAKYLMVKYPTLFRYSDKRSGQREAELKIRFTTVYQVALWREKILNLRRLGEL